MVTNHRSTERADETHSPSPTELFTIIEHPLRRTLLRYLSERDPPLPLTELVAALAEDESVSVQNRQRLTIELHHNHLPRLSDVGFVSYDVETATIECTFDDSVFGASFELLTGSSV